MQIGIKVTKKQYKELLRAVNTLKNIVGSKRKMTAVVENYNDLINHYYLNQQQIDIMKKERVNSEIKYYTIFTNQVEKALYDKIKIISTTNLLFTILHKYK